MNAFYEHLTYVSLLVSTNGADIWLYFVLAFWQNVVSKRKFRHSMLARLLQRRGRRLKIFWGKTVIRLIQK